MVLGFVKCRTEKKVEIARSLRALKRQHGLRHNFELKWGQVSNSRIQYFLDVVDLFFNEPSLSFRAVVAKKEGLNHSAFQQSHDDWYYKIAYRLLLPAVKEAEVCDVFFDRRDTDEASKIENLNRILSNSIPTSRDVRTGVRIPVDSRQVELLQLADLLIGAISYVNRGLASSPARIQLVEHIQQKSGLTLKSTTGLGIHKFNLFFWTPQMMK